MQLNLFPFGSNLGNPFLFNGDLSDGLETPPTTNVLFLLPFLLFQGGGGGMDLSKVGEKILSSVRSARSFGLLPPASDCPEVYEHITFNSEKHISLASFPGMQERTIITSSLSKTFSVTGWRVGWAIAPSFIASAIRNIHVKVTDSAPAPFQEAALIALRSPPEYFESLRSDYESRRDFIVNLLARIGFKIQFKPQGAFFLFAELPENCPLSDVEYVKKLIQQAGVVAVPGCGFFHSVTSVEKLSQEGYSYQDRYIRFAFCKSDRTLASAAQKLEELLDAAGCLKLQ